MEYYNNEIIINDEEKRNKIYQDITLLRDLGQKVLMLNKEKTKFECFQNDAKIMQINFKLKEIKDYIETTFPYYGKENVKYDDDTNFNHITSSNNEDYKINIVEDKLNESNKNNYITNSNININTNNKTDNDIKEEEEIIDNNDNINDNINDNNINDDDSLQKEIEKYKAKEMSQKSREILRRHQEKLKMIKENMEIAEQNRMNDKRNLI